MAGLATLLSHRPGFCRIRDSRQNTPAAGTTQINKAICNVRIPTKLVGFIHDLHETRCVAARSRHTKSVAAAAPRFAAQTVDKCSALQTSWDERRFSRRDLVGLLPPTLLPAHPQ